MGMAGWLAGCFWLKGDIIGRKLNRQQQQQQHQQQQEAKRIKLPAKGFFSVCVCFLAQQQLCCFFLQTPAEGHAKFNSPKQSFVRNFRFPNSVGAFT